MRALTSETIVAVADCWANNFPENMDKNLNALGLGMGVWGGALNRSFLKFSLIGLLLDPNKLVKAELKLYGARIHTTAKARAYYTINSFSETTLTWRNQPPPTTLHWNGSGSLMGETDVIPGAASWYTIPIDTVFVKHRWGQHFWVILRGTEELESYCWAEDKEAGAAYAPKLVLTTEEIPLSATLTASPTSGPPPLAVTFTMGINGGTSPYTWSLDPGDGSAPYTGSRSASGTFTKVHTYTKVGTFTATLTVTDALGASSARLLDLFAGVAPPWLPDWADPLARLALVLAVGGVIVIGTNELQKAKIIG